MTAVAWAAPRPSPAADAPSPTPAGAEEPTVADCGRGPLVSQDTAVTGFCVPDLLGGAWLRECRNGNAFGDAAQLQRASPATRAGPSPPQRWARASFNHRRKTPAARQTSLEMQHCVIPAAPHWCVPGSLTLSVATEVGDTTTASPLVAATPEAVTIRTNASAVPPFDGDSLLAVAGTNLSVVMSNRCVFGDDGVLGRRSVGTYYNCLPKGSLRVTTGCNAACLVCQDAHAVFPNATRSLVPFAAHVGRCRTPRRGGCARGGDRRTLAMRDRPG